MNKKITHIDFCLIGISNHPKPFFTDEVLRLIQNGSVFSGGKRHHKLVQSFLPENYKWIDITGNMPSLMNQYKNIETTIIVFVSGDPFFYGFGNTLQRLLPEAKLKSYPYFNSIQLLCQKTQTNYNDLRNVSVHGRKWVALDEALIKNEALIGVLTDAQKSPNAIAERMLHYGFDNYTITVGEALDGAEEGISEFTLLECSNRTFRTLNCVLLKQTHQKTRQFGIKDTDFVPLPNRPNMITKMPVRLSTLHALNLSKAKVLWDIGACTGSVSIEAKQHFPHLEIIAFEKRIACDSVIQQNTIRFSTPGITSVIADFFELELSVYPIPDVVFIGGHGGRLKELLQIIHNLNPSTKIVTNAVSETSTQVFTEELKKLEYIVDTTIIQVNEHNKISIHTAVKEISK